MKPRAKDWNKIYLEGKHFTPVENKLVGRLLKFAKKRIGEKIKNVLDLGCGTGDFAVKLAKKGLRVVCVDFSPIALKIARENAQKGGVGRGIKFVKHDLEKLEKLKSPEKFDLAVHRLTFAFIKNKKDFFRQSGHY